MDLWVSYRNEHGLVVAQLTIGLLIGVRSKNSLISLFIVDFVNEMDIGGQNRYSL